MCKWKQNEIWQQDERKQHAVPKRRPIPILPSYRGPYAHVAHEEAVDRLRYSR